MVKSNADFLDRVQHWSSPMDSLYMSEVQSAVMKDARTDNDEYDNLMPLGASFSVVREDVVGHGRADFAKPFELSNGKVLTADDRVLLYCFLHLRKHYWANYAHFRLSKARLSRAFSGRRPVLVDIGCGPGTAALAFSQVFPGLNFTYIGVDSARAMRKKCRSIFEKAQELGLISAQSSLVRKSSWEAINEKFSESSTVLFNGSYFFASLSLDSAALASLADCITMRMENSGDARFFMSYTNSPFPGRSDKYFTFQRKLGIDGSNSTLSSSLQERHVRFRKRLGQSFSDSDTFVRELFEFDNHA